jgi:glutathione-independent formaldehyde dehydrogenase
VLLHFPDLQALDTVTTGLRPNQDCQRGYGEFDAGVRKKFVIDPHGLFGGV